MDPELHMYTNLHVGYGLDVNGTALGKMDDRYTSLCPEDRRPDLSKSIRRWHTLIDLCSPPLFLLIQFEIYTQKQLHSGTNSNGKVAFNEKFYLFLTH